MPDSYLEPEFKDSFNTWQTAPDKHNSSMLLSKLQPVMDRAISAHVGGQANPLLRSHARKLTLRALSSYDPTRASLATHLTNQLQGLRRISRQQQQVIRIPERVSLDQGRLVEVENELRDELGRDPTTIELADRSGLSTKRISHVRRFKPAVAEGTLTAWSEAQEEGGGFDPAVQVMDQQNDPWVELVYHDQDPINQKIMEMTLGMFGNKQLSNQQIAGKLRLSPGAVSQRKLQIQRVLDQKDDLHVF